MTNWTDEQIIAKLANTFEAHAHDIDPELAMRIARTTKSAPKRQWAVLVSAAAVVLLIIGAATLILDRDNAHRADPGTRAPLAVEVPEPATEGSNRKAAVAEAANVLRTLPVPPGAIRLDRAPDGFQASECICGSVDASLTRTNYWIVPLSPAALVTWFHTHSPADITGAFLPNSKVASPAGDMLWSVPSNSAAFSDPTVYISYARLSATTTAIGATVYLAALSDRTAKTLAPDTVTSIEITKTTVGGPEHASVTRTITDRSKLAAIVTAFNDLKGSATDSQFHACGSGGIGFSYTVTFNWPGHSLTVDPGHASCGKGRGLSLNGAQLPQTLDNTSSNDALDGASERALTAP